jgi:hypothetical protein
MVAETQNMDDVCKVPEPKNIPFPEKRKMHEHDQERNVTSSNIKKNLLHNKLKLDKEGQAVLVRGPVL